VSAHAASLEASQACYPNGKKVSLSGAGFAPEDPVTFKVNGRKIGGSAITDADGSFRANYPPPTAETEDRLVIRATDSVGTTAKTVVFVTVRRGFRANPDTTTNVRTWRAVFKLFGFGAGRKAFVHYIDPDGKHRKTIKLGRLKGPCGRLKTERRRVLPFRNPDTGRWKLQFDTRRRFSRKTTNKRVIPVKVFLG